MTTPAFPAKKRLLVSLLSIAVLSACGGGGGGSAASDQAAIDDQFLARGKGNSGTQPGNNGKGSKDGSTTPTSPTTDDTTTQPAPTTDTEAPLAPSTGTGTDTTSPSADTTTPAPTPAPEPAPAPPPTSQISSIVAGPAINLPGAITTVAIDSTASTSQANVPVTFGQVFKQGDVLPSEKLTGKLADGSAIPIQVDIKATHADGSLRHAIISAVLPSLPAGKSMSIGLVKTAETATVVPATSPTTLTNAGFTASANITLGGQVYSASADELLKNGKVTIWLSGPIVNEWHVWAPLKAGGAEHPHLTARFAIRSYAGMNKARVDVTIENNWAYESGPQNFTYDAQVVVGEQNAYSKAGLTHYRQARWRKVFWWGGQPNIYIKHNTAYLITTRALPNYDQSIAISETSLNALITKWESKNSEPMAPGIVNPLMPTAGGRPDIGPFPQWAAQYLLSMDTRAKNVTLGTGDLAGSWPIHYRDKNTGQPVSLADYPYMGLFGVPSDKVNPTTKLSEAFPVCGGDCSTSPYNYNPDSAHQPSLTYLPYIVTGDYYYLEELQFWANWNMLRANPYYRNFDKGLVKWDEVRGQAWSTRTLGHAAYITPDTHPMKQYFAERVKNNLDWYNTTYVNGNPNQLGYIDGSGSNAFKAILYTTPSGAQTGIAPWQDDFFTWSAGHLNELGFSNAQPLLAWKAKFPVGRLTAAGYCWIDGAAYTLAVRSSSTSAPYATFKEAYLSTMRAADGTPLINSTGAQYLNQACNSQAQADWRTQKDKDENVRRSAWQVGEMTGYADSTIGYPSNMQPALAVAAQSGIQNAQTAWEIFIKRPIKPDYSAEPQWAIVPRN